MNDIKHQVGHLNTHTTCQSPVPPYKCHIARVNFSLLWYSNNFVVLDLARSWCISQKIFFRYNWYNFLGHENSFLNAIVSRLITLQTLENQNICDLFISALHLTLSCQKALPCYHFLLYKTQPSSKKRTLVKVLGQIIDDQYLLSYAKV